METILKWFLVAAICAAIVFGVVHFYESWRTHVFGQGDTAGAARVQGRWDTDVRRRDGDKLAAVAKARTEEQEAAQAVVKGERDAREKAERLATAARNDAVLSRRSAGGLLGSIQALDRAAGDVGVPNAASCPGEFVSQRDAAVRGRKLLAACSTEYRELAEGADVSWTALTLKLDTALGYVNAVAPR